MRILNHLHASPIFLAIGLLIVMLFSIVLGLTHLNQINDIKTEASEMGLPPQIKISNNWPQFHNTANRGGVNYSENVLDSTNVGGLKMKWRAWLNSTGGYSNSSPAVVDGVIYVGSNDSNFYAIKATDGSIVWKYKTEASIDSSPAVYNGVVYFGSDDHKIYALNSADGTKLWAFSTGDKVSSSPLVAAGVVYIGSNDGIFRALNSSSGSLIWQNPNMWEIRKGSTLGIGIVYVASDKSILYAFDAKTGSIKWTAPLGGMGRSTPSTASRYNFVYVGAEDGRLYAFDATTGALKWKTPVLGVITPSVVRSSPTIWNDKIYVTTNEGDGVTTADGHQYAFNAETGQQLWIAHLPDMSGFSAAVANGILFTSGFGHNAYAFDAVTGVKLWNAGFNTFIGNTGGAVVVNSNLYFLNQDGYLYDYADLTGPDIIFDSSPKSLTNLPSATFSWHASENLVGSPTCTLDDIVVPCSLSSYATAGLKEGPHIIKIAATDKSNNVKTTQYSWTVDLTPPTVSILRSPLNPTTENSPTFNISSNETNSTFLCKLDSQSQQTCNAWPKYTNLPDGNHTFTAWAVDQAGNTSAPASSSWLQDATAPTISVNGPTSINYGTSPSWTEAANETVTFYCSKDGGTYKLCPSPTLMDKPSVGTHTITWYAVDAVWHKSNYVTINLTVNP